MIIDIKLFYYIYVIFNYYSDFKDKYNILRLVEFILSI